MTKFHRTIKLLCREVSTVPISRDLQFHLLSIKIKRLTSGILYG